MQDRYVGDIGDFAKYSFLNSLAENQLLGVAWYLYPDESHNSDGKHVSYLDQHQDWHEKDPHVFDKMRLLVDSGQRSVANVEKYGVLKRAIYASSPLSEDSRSPNARKLFRREWFAGVTKALERAEVVFADPDNGLRVRMH